MIYLIIFLSLYFGIGLVLAILVCKPHLYMVGVWLTTGDFIKHFFLVMFTWGFFMCFEIWDNYAKRMANRESE